MFGNLYLLLVATHVGYIPSLRHTCTVPCGLNITFGEYLGSLPIPKTRSPAVQFPLKPTAVGVYAL